MDKFIVEGGHKLSGNVTISGAKNAALAIIPSVLLAQGTFRFSNIPNIRDIWTLSRLLHSMGIHSELNNDELFVDSTGINSTEAPYEHVKKMRASINVLGPLVARHGHAKVSLPGGCSFGPRPVDLHLKGLEKLGATITLDSGYILAESKRLQGAKFHFDISSVGASENVISAAVLAKGSSLLTNVAVEPEVTALCKLLVKMGAKINGIGTTTLEIEGVDTLHAVDEVNIPDRIEAATFLIIGAMTKSTITVEKTNAYHLTAVIQALEESGAEVDVTGENITISMDKAPEPVNVATAVYPGFPTDVQAQWAAYMMMTQHGNSRVTDNIYKSRFLYVPELHRLGADIEVIDNTAIINSGATLKAATVMSSDLRASASLILAALVAEGKTEILRVYHLDRGYENLEKKLSNLGASVKRIKTEEY
ncbi:MAG: UDP-N-acetylglucosamine 1-carboxyvinyltransferase [Candidatus Kapabacteria bacterium]|nr:UDP-N-acetylglucosamine 1-carboxyvinyltransferase [Candidatus Kapabacteria bacterium]